MNSTQIPAKMTGLGRAGFLLMILSILPLFNIALYALLQTSAVQYDKVALFLLLLVLGYVLLRQDPVYRVIKHRMFLNTTYLADSERRRKGFPLFMVGVALFASGTQSLQAIPPLSQSWIIYLLATVCLSVGGALVLLKEPEAVSELKQND